jgi:hypothetical protein
MSKYDRKIVGRIRNETNQQLSNISERSGEIYVDVYDVLVAFGVTCPARQHAIKKLLCAGLRGKGSVRDDLMESLMSIERALELHEIAIDMENCKTSETVQQK